MIIDSKTGRVLGEDSVETLEGLGRIGRRMRFGDFRDVSGMTLPFKTQIKYANAVIGTIVTTVSEVEVGVELPDNSFQLRD